ncbi:MAG: cytochrome c3 family protein [Acidobacteriia bacterium]|nr:cytochrome c3 family protein [Terriglobia bacterium]
MMLKKMDKWSLEIADMEWARADSRLLFLALGAAILVGAEQIQAQVTTEHPFIEPSAIKSETCLTCHPDKKEGKFVHSAVAMGCENCHQASSENGKTAITLVATGGELCATCHEAKKEPVLHVPYREGQCLICHEPHTSNFPRQVRAETNLLCLSCHGVNQPEVKVNQEIKTVSLLGGRTLTLDDYRQAVKIGLDRSGTKGHPIVGHPVSGRDPRNKDAALNCLSCHASHSSALARLMPADVNPTAGHCARCHQ